MWGNCCCEISMVYNLYLGLFVGCDREWYSWHFPEMVKIVNDNYMYSKLVKFVKDKKSLTSDSLEEISEITGDEDKAREVIEAAKASMGRILPSKAKAKGLVFLMLDFLFYLESKSWRDKGPESLYVRCVQAKIFHQWI